jgi:hypothetical protein
MKVWFRLLLSIVFGSLLLTGSLLSYPGHAELPPVTSKEQKNTDTTPKESVYSAAATLTVTCQVPEADVLYLPTASYSAPIAVISEKLNTNETAVVARQIFLKTLLTDILSPQAP